MIKIIYLLYSTSIFSWLRRILTHHAFFSRLAGSYCNRSMSRVHIRRFIKQNNINVDEFKKKVHEFTSFNDFFIRELHYNARIIDVHEHSIISPADGTVSLITLAEKTNFKIKNITFSLEQFLHNKDLAHTYQDGIMLSIRLAPWDYHRFHFPITCNPTDHYRIKGNYQSVNPLVFDFNINPLVENERRYLILKNTLYNDIIMVSIGALFVGSIIHTYQPHTVHKKGDQAGYFCFGGSTIVLIFKKDTLQLNPQLIQHGIYTQEVPIKMGQSLGTFL